MSKEYICPHCDYAMSREDVYSIWGELGGNECTETYCDRCGKEIVIIAHIDVSFKINAPKETRKCLSQTKSV